MMNENEKPGLVVAIGERPEGKEGDGKLDAMSAAANVDTVPLDALQMPDDQDQMQAPEVGDQVDYQVTGKVVAVEGGFARVQRTAINGQDVQGTNDDDEGRSPQNADSAEAQGLRDQAGGMGMMMMSVILFLALLLAPSAFAQNTTVTGNASLTNLLAVSQVPVKLYAVIGYNSAGSPEFVQVFNTETSPTNGTVPVFSIPVAAGQYFSFDFSYYGADLDNVWVASSSTASSLTLTAAQTSFQAITKSR
jgi:hypothetical protein